MKTKYLLIMMAIASLIMGCNREEKSLFDESASVRIEKALTNAHDVLINAENGWDILYFANDYSRGYHIAADFVQNGQVKAMMKNEMVTNSEGAFILVEDTVSLWAIVMDYGPILTFNTYNNILHLWADPQEDGLGYEGDYEFLVLEATPDILRLKGKKYYAYSTLYPIPAGKNKELYLDELNALEDRWFGNSNLLEFFDGRNYFTLHDAETGLISVAEHNKAAEDTAAVHNFITTPTGIQFMKAWSSTESPIYTYRNGRLESGNCVISAGKLGSYFYNYLTLAMSKWVLDLEDTNDSTASIVAKIEEQYHAQDPNAKVNNFLVSYVPAAHVDSLGKFVFEYHYTLKNKDSKGAFTFKVTRDENSVTLAYVEAYDKDGKNILNNKLVGNLVKELLLSVNGTYTLETTEEPLNPTIGTKITNTDNANLWFRLTGL